MEGETALFPVNQSHTKLVLFGACFGASGSVHCRHPKQRREDSHMNKKLAELAIRGSHLNRSQLQLLVLIMSLAMLVLGVGAPSDGGG